MTEMFYIEADLLWLKIAGQELVEEICLYLAYVAEFQRRHGL